MELAWVVVGAGALALLLSHMSPTRRMYRANSRAMRRASRYYDRNARRYHRRNR